MKTVAILAKSDGYAGVYISCGPLVLRGLFVLDHANHEIDVGAAAIESARPLDLVQAGRQSRRVWGEFPHPCAVIANASRTAAILLGAVWVWPSRPTSLTVSPFGRRVGRAMTVL